MAGKMVFTHIGPDILRCLKNSAVAPIFHIPERITRRATIWQSTANGWCILYHQGTIVTAEKEDAHP
jgi:hypothetical protein